MKKKKPYRNINDLELLLDQINDIDSDFKAETIAAEIIENGYNPDQIHILRNGGSRRGHAKDLEDVYLQFSQQDLRDHLYIHVNKEGVYDILPEGLFHQPIQKRLEKDKEDILDEIKVHRNEEFFARKFFRLFETEVDRMHIEGSLYEIKFEKKISNENFINVFQPYWPIIKLLNIDQAIRFLHIIPVLHKVRSKYDEAANAISLILEVPIEVLQIKLQKKDVGDNYESVVGERCLGIDWVLGNSFDDGIYDLKMTIGPIPAKQMAYFLETGVGYKILDTLCQLFFSANIFIVREFKVYPEDASFILSSHEDLAYLGINTFI